MKKTLAITALTAVTILLIGQFIPSTRGYFRSHFYWSQTSVNTNSISTCYSFAETVLRYESFADIRRSAGEVTGSKGSTYVAIMCVGTSPRATAVVATVSDQNSEASRIRDLVTTKIRGVKGY